MRVAPDDDVYRVNAVWLGPRGLTFPWTARYLAYATWLVTFLVILLVEGITPLNVGMPPVWEICIGTLFTYAVMSFVDHERPVRAVWRTFVADLGAPRPVTPGRPLRTSPRVRVRERAQHDRRLTRADFTRPGSVAPRVRSEATRPRSTSGRTGRAKAAATKTAGAKPATTKTRRTATSTTATSKAPAKSGAGPARQEGR